MPLLEFHDLEMYSDAFEQEQILLEEYERDQLENPEPVLLEADWPLIAPRPVALIPSNLPF